MTFQVRVLDRVLYAARRAEGPRTGRATNLHLTSPGESQLSQLSGAKFWRR